MLSFDIKLIHWEQLVNKRRYLLMPDSFAFGNKDNGFRDVFHVAGDSFEVPDNQYQVSGNDNHIRLGGHLRDDFLERSLA